MTGEQLDKILGDWWRDHIANSPISRSTEAYNALVAKFDILKRELHLASATRAPATSEADVINHLLHAAQIK